MINMSLPDYYKAGLIDSEGVNELSDEQLLNGYLIVNTYFNFTWHVKYPSIPCYIDKTTTVYPPPPPTKRSFYYRSWILIGESTGV